MHLTFIILVCTFAFITCDDVLRFSKDNYGKECPNRRTRCQEDQTCCPTKHGSYHCCRYRNAECCPDKYHCCPEGSRCDARAKRCTRDASYHPLKQILNDPIEWKVDTKQCPDKKSACGNKQTCCSSSSGSYNCCPFGNATCCTDNKHCCPSDYKCDLVNMVCKKNNEENMMKLELPIGYSTNEVKPVDLQQNDWANLEMKEIKKIVAFDQLCPNNKTHCKDTKTCCITKHGNYYCCPHKNAVCCPDKYHCCPEGSTCDSKTNKCSGSVPQINMHRFIKDDHLDKFCMNSEAKCPGKKRCCNMEGGKFGCCEFNKGVCCPDLKTCCPHDTTCNVEKKTCEANPQSLSPIKEKTKKMKKQRKSLMIFLDQLNLKNKCPNGSKCPGLSTCCPLKDKEQFGCCPYTGGVCCPDKKSCCPNGTQCNGADGCKKE